VWGILRQIQKRMESYSWWMRLFWLCVIALGGMSLYAFMNVQIWQVVYFMD
jgi:hypothetical protein